MAPQPLKSSSLVAKGPKAANVANVGGSIERRIGQRIQPQANGCWLFRGVAEQYGVAATVRRCGTSDGYQQGVHRFVYEALVGPIDDGYHLHHTCETPGCCNPACLLMVTPEEHRALHARHREPAYYRPKHRVGGKKGRVIPIYRVDPATGKYTNRKAG